MWLFLGRCELREDTKVLQRCRVAIYFCAARNLFEEPAHDFAAARFWQRFGKTNVIGFRDGADFLAT